MGQSQYPYALPPWETLKLYSLADFSGSHIWDDLVGNDTGKIYMTIVAQPDLIGSLTEEPEKRWLHEQILEDLESGDLQVVMSDWGNPLQHDIFIPEEEITPEIIRFHLEIFNFMHPELPDYEFVEGVPDFWEEKIKEWAGDDLVEG